MSLVAVVPMKGHSERVPGKNLRPIAGRPLFHWVVTTLLDAELVDRVVVETDSDTIETATYDAFGEQVEVMRRPDELHGDFVPMHDIVANFARSVDNEDILQTHSTNPLLQPDTVDAAIRAYRQAAQHDSLMSVTPWHTRLYDTSGSPINHDPAELIRTQDLDPVYEENSNLYIAPRRLVIEIGRRVGPSPLLFPIAAHEAIDIDDEFDFAMAEYLLERRHV